MTFCGNNFNDFSEKQLTIDFEFLCKPTWRNAIVSLFPFVLISFGGTASTKNIWGKLGNFVPPRLHHWECLQRRSSLSTFMWRSVKKQHH